jgi:hypothetical protein
MTLLVSWVGVDTHGVASAYIAADSRISWEKTATFDHGRKVFAMRRSPDILGYCGDVLFPTMVLAQITEMADHGLLFSANAPCKTKFEAIKEKLVEHFHRYPRMVERITADTLQVLHISRDPVDNLKFSCWRISWTRKSGWMGSSTPMPTESGILFLLGSGAPDFSRNYQRYTKGPDRSTSRSVFHCFCGTLLTTQDEHCGGAPQLVGIYRKPSSPANAYGIIWEKKRYFLGALVDRDVDFSGVEWRNELFELCDGSTMKRLPEAQPQPDVLRGT